MLSKANMATPPVSAQAALISATQQLSTKAPPIACEARPLAPTASNVMSAKERRSAMSAWRSEG
jgi:hypothetical protein